jgi:hypothetical protein
MPQYLTNLKKKIENNKNHPLNKGLKMQAHHILSKKGVKDSGLGDKLERLGYDINHTKNLAFIPSTLQGACHLGVQPHRGDHTASSEIDDETDHDDSYHLMVMKKVRELEKYLENKCPGRDAKKSEEIIKMMNKRSQEILDLINNHPAQAKLTAMAKYYAPNNPVGCGGMDNIPKPGQAGRINPARCPVGRDHQKKALGKKAYGPNQSDEDINFPKPNPSYKLKTGE